MNIHKAELDRKASRPQEFPKGVFSEVAFLGRSNVGKSSLINLYLGRKNLAKTSSTPGKTKALFFYLVNDSFYLVDLPGYGYARVSKKLRMDWGNLIESYLDNREQLRGLVHIVDIRHSPSSEDKQMAEWLLYHDYPFITVATKADKISRGRYTGRIKEIRGELGLKSENELVVFSATNGEGAREVTAYIDNLIK